MSVCATTLLVTRLAQSMSQRSRQSIRVQRRRRRVLRATAAIIDKQNFKEKVVETFYRLGKGKNDWLKLKSSIILYSLIFFKMLFSI
jgi:hypothetical protein